jgi:hypothetical protein
MKPRDPARLIVLLVREGQFGTAARPRRISANLASSCNYLATARRLAGGLHSTLPRMMRATSQRASHSLNSVCMNGWFMPSDATP